MTAGKDNNPLSNILSTVGNLLIRLSGEKEGNSSEANTSTSQQLPSYRQIPAQEAEKDLLETQKPRLSQSEIDEQAFWMKRLAEITAQFDIELGVTLGQRGEYIHVGQASDSTDGLLQELYSYFNELSTAFNNATTSTNAWRVRITVSDFHESGKPKDAKQAQMLTTTFACRLLHANCLSSGSLEKFTFI